MSNNAKNIIRLIYYTILIVMCLYIYDSNKVLIKESFKNKKNIPELVQYREKLLDISEGALGYDTGIPLTWMPLEVIKGNPRALAVCYGIYPFNMNISVKKTHWKYMSEKKRIILLAHEFIHCSCYRMHSDKVMKDGCESSIMNPSIPSMYCINKHYGRYLKEIKRGCE